MKRLKCPGTVNLSTKRSVFNTLSSALEPIIHTVAIMCDDLTYELIQPDHLGP
jgi:hypothetical protein